MIKTGYSDPKLYEYGGNLTKEWYVGFRHTCPSCNTRKPYQFRMGINFLSTVATRRDEGKAVARILKRALADQWNPHHEQIENFLRRQIEQKDLPEDDLGLMPFNQALDFALEKKKTNLADKTYSCFKTGKEYAQRSAIKLGYYAKPVKEMKRRHIKELMDQICRDRQAEYDLIKSGPNKGRKISGNFYNKYKGYIQCILSELVEFDAIEYNPCDKIKDKPKITTNVHRHASQKERDLIRSTLQLKCPRFYIYLLIEYMCGIRPKEIFFIRICDIDWFNGSFILYGTEEATKTRTARHVPIPDELMKHLKNLKLETVNPLDYLFSDAFRPGAIKKNRDYATRLWKELIKDGLGLTVSLYSFKGLGGDDKRDAGISLQAVSSQYGHTKIGTTLIYTHKEKERMNDELRQKTRAL